MLVKDVDIPRGREVPCVNVPAFYEVPAMDDSGNVLAPSGTGAEIVRGAAHFGMNPTRDRGISIKAEPRREASPLIFWRQAIKTAHTPKLRSKKRPAGVVAGQVL
jgi:hypothetical protein